MRFSRRPRLIPCLSLVIALLALCAPVQAEIIRGAGSTAAARLYRNWGEAFGRTGNTLQYEANGSSAGLKALLEGKADFGATDVPLPEEQLRSKGLILIPTAITGVVPALNLPGIPPGRLRLSGPVLAAMYAGTIRRWNDEAIRLLNPGLTLPAENIRVVAREDGSGTTYVMSQYLSSVSADWKTRMGVDFRLSWPDGTLLAKGSSEVVKLLTETPYALGYLEIGYVEKSKLGYALVANRAGNYVSPRPAAFHAALDASNWSFQGRFEESLSNLDARDAWPITTGTFVVVSRVSSDPKRTALLLNFFSGAFMQADKLVPESGLVPLPVKTQARAIKTLGKVVDAEGIPVFFDVMWRIPGAH